MAVKEAEVLSSSGIGIDVASELCSGVMEFTLTQGWFCQLNHSVSLIAGILAAGFRR